MAGVVAGWIPIVSVLSPAVRLAVAYTSTPFVSVYDVPGFWKIANPATLPASTGNGVAFG